MNEIKLSVFNKKSIKKTNAFSIDIFNSVVADG